VDPYHWITDPDPDPALFFSGFPVGQQQLILKSFFLMTYRRYIFISLKDKKNIKKPQNCTIPGFSQFIRLLMEGPGFVQIITDLDPRGPNTSVPEFIDAVLGLF
jgi:hypothetical protein